MALPTKQKISIAEFKDFVEQPANSEKIFELINGEIVEVPNNPLASEIAFLVGFLIRTFLVQNNIDAHITVDGGGYFVDGNAFAPDVAYISYERQAQLENDGFNPLPPELAVEVISKPHSSKEQAELRRKLVHYMRANVVIWIVDYAVRQVEVHMPGQDVQIYNEEDSVPGGEVLPGFEMPVKDIFPKGMKA